jgi:MFS superfamily sulfate permease-like transporter
MLERLRLFFTLFDSRFEDLDRTTWKTTVYRDFSAGLIVAMTAIPMAMGFAMASGLRPEQGIIAGAMACLVGRTFGGSKYQVYGPTAAFIPLIAGIMAHYNHGFLVLVSCIAGVILMLMGLGGLGRVAKVVPESIIVGFTVGIGVSIALANAGDAFGFSAALGGGLLQKARGIVQHWSEFNGYALGLALLTFALTKGLLRVSIFIPAPLIAMAASTGLAMTLFADKGIVLVKDRFGSIPTNFFVFTPPTLPALTGKVVFDIAYYVVAIVFVSGVESLLCSSMADKLANNRKTPFNPDKEFWGQGLVQIVAPLINGFPCTGALARTATSIRAGALTPLAGYFKGVLKLVLAYYIARYLELIPMACIGGILLWVATNMIKVSEIKHILTQGRFHSLLMVYTAVMVPVTDFLTGVLSALVLYAIGYLYLKSKGEPPAPAPAV